MAASSSQSALRIASGGGAYARLDLTHSLYPGRRWAEIVFGLGSTISEAKDKIYKHTGTSPENMQVYLCFPAGCEEGGGGGSFLLASPTMTLGEAGCVDGCRLHIVDTSREEKTSGAGGAGSEGNGSIDGDLVAKYVMDDEVYDKRPNTMRKFLSKLQQERPDLCEKKQGKESHSKDVSSSTSMTAEEEEKMWISQLEEARAKFKLGDRCRITAGDRRGSIAYVGPRPSMNRREIWIGIALDEPVGSTDGTDRKKGRTAEKGVTTRLFECNGEKYGEFGRLDEVEVGDFPPLDPFDLLDEI